MYKKNIIKTLLLVVTPAVCFISIIAAQQPDIAATLQTNTSASSYHHVLDALRTIPERMDGEHLLEIGSAVAVHALTKKDDGLRFRFVSRVIKNFLAKHNLDKTFYTRSFDIQWIHKKIPFNLRIKLGVKEFITSAYLLTQTATPLNCLFPYASPEPINTTPCAHDGSKRLMSISEMLYPNARVKRFIPIYDYQLIMLVNAFSKNIAAENSINDAKDKIKTISKNRINQYSPATRFIRTLQKDKKDTKQKLLQQFSSLGSLHKWETSSTNSEKLCVRIMREPIVANRTKLARLTGIIYRRKAQLPFCDTDTKKINTLKQSIAQSEQKHIIKDIGVIFGYNVVSSAAHAVAHTTGIDHNKLELLFAQDCRPKTNMQTLAQQMVARLFGHTFDRFFEPSRNTPEPLQRHFLAQRKQEIRTDNNPDTFNKIGKS